MSSKERARYVSLLACYLQREAGFREQAKADPDDLYARRMWRATAKHRRWLQGVLRQEATA